MFREQVLKLEEQVSKKIEQEDVTREIFKGREAKLSQRLKLCSERYKELEKRRQKEIEGFKNELKQLRDKLRNMEKNFFKASLERKNFDVINMEKIDGEEVLKNIYDTTQRSREMQGELQQLKAKIYTLENDIKKL